MDRESAIAKIKKCLSLAKSANETEAATALRQAQALMREHNLDEQGVALTRVREESVRARLMPIVQWESLLIDTVAQAFGCHVISATKLVSLLEMKRVRYWRLFGVDFAPEIAGYTFEVLAGQCVRARRAHIGKQSKNCKPATRTARGDAFALGWVRGVKALIERFANGERNEALIAAYMRENYPDLADAKVHDRVGGRNVKDDHMCGGMAAAKASLHRGVGSPLERKLIGA